MCRRVQDPRGVTLIEVLLALSIVAIMLGAVISPLGGQCNHPLLGAQEAWYAVARHARSAALRGEPIVIELIDEGRILQARAARSQEVICRRPLPCEVHLVLIVDHKRCTTVVVDRRGVTPDLTVIVTGTDDAVRRWTVAGATGQEVKEQRR